MSRIAVAKKSRPVALAKSVIGGTTPGLYERELDDEGWAPVDELIVALCEEVRSLGDENSFGKGEFVSGRRVNPHRLANILGNGSLGGG